MNKKRRILAACTSLIAVSAYATPSVNVSPVIHPDTNVRGGILNYSAGINALSNDGKLAGGWISPVVTATPWTKSASNPYGLPSSYSALWSGDNFTELKTLSQSYPYAYDYIQLYQDVESDVQVFAISGDGSTVAASQDTWQINPDTKQRYQYVAIFKGKDFSDVTELSLATRKDLTRDLVPRFFITALSDNGTVAVGDYYSNYSWIAMNNLRRKGYDVSDNNLYGKGYTGVIFSGKDYKTVTDLSTDIYHDLMDRPVYAANSDATVLAGSLIDNTIEPPASEIEKLNMLRNTYGWMRESAAVWSGEHWSEQNILPLPAGFNKTNINSFVSGLSATGDIAAGNLTTATNCCTYYQGKPTIEFSAMSSVGYERNLDVPFPDGKVNVQRHGVVWSGQNMQTVTLLSGLHESDLTGVNALSKDGRVVAGWSESAEKSLTQFNGSTKTPPFSILASDINRDFMYPVYHAAVIWSGKNWKTVTNLQQGMGNVLYSEARAVNADGTIVGGTYVLRKDVEDEFMLQSAAKGDGTSYQNPAMNWIPHRPALWRITWPEPLKEAAEQSSGENLPVADTSVQPKVTMIDLMNTRESIYRTGSDALSALEMQRNALLRLHDSCVSGHQGEFCYSLKTGMTTDGDDKDIYGGFTLGYGLNDYLTAGISLDHSFSRSMPDSFGNAGNNLGGGVFVHLRQPVGEHEFYIEPSFAFNSTDVDITRSASGLAYTEKARGVSRIKGTGASLETGFNFSTTERLRTGLYVGARHSRVQRDAYTERNAAFPVSYDDMVYSSTVALAGARLNVALTESLSWNSGIEVERELAGKK